MIIIKPKKNKYRIIKTDIEKDNSWIENNLGKEFNIPTTIINDFNNNDID